MRLLHVIEARLAVRYERLMTHVLGGFSGMGLKQSALGLGSRDFLVRLHRLGVDARLLDLHGRHLGRSRLRLARDVSFFVNRQGFSHLLAWGRSARSLVRQQVFSGVFRIGVVFDYDALPEPQGFDGIVTFRDALRTALQQEKGWDVGKVVCVPFLVAPPRAGVAVARSGYALSATASVLGLYVTDICEEGLADLFAALQKSRDWYVFVFAQRGLDEKVAALSVPYGIRPRLRFVAPGADFISHLRGCDAVAFVAKDDVFVRPLVQAWSYQKVVLVSQARYLDRRWLTMRMFLLLIRHLGVLL